MLRKRKPYCELTVDRVIKVLELISKKTTEKKETNQNLEFLTVPPSIFSIHSSLLPNFLNGFATITRIFSLPNNYFRWIQQYCGKFSCLVISNQDRKDFTEVLGNQELKGKTVELRNLSMASHLDIKLLKYFHSINGLMHCRLQLRFSNYFGLVGDRSLIYHNRIKK